MFNKKELKKIKKTQSVILSLLKNIYTFLLFKECFPETKLLSKQLNISSEDLNVLNNPMLCDDLNILHNDICDLLLRMLAPLSRIETDSIYEERKDFYSFLLTTSNNHKSRIILDMIKNSFWQRDIDNLKIYFEMAKNISNFPLEGFLYNISFLYLLGEKEAAKTLLRNKISLYDKSILIEYLPIAYLVYEMKLDTSDSFMKSAKVFEAFETGNKDKLFENLIKNKRIAVVGNGPQEINKKRGHEIDAYDIVIRFNGYNTDDFACDYGTKTSICARWHGTPFPKDNLSLIFSPEDVYFVRYSQQSINEYYDYINNGGKISFFSYKWEFHSDTKMTMPTTGAQVIWLVKKINPEFSADDCFGFSFKEEKLTERFTHDYYNPTEIISVQSHNLMIEKNVIHKILGA